MLLVFLPAVLIPASDSSSPAFHMIDPAYKLNKQGDNTQPWCTPFPVWNQSVVPCLVLIVASWPAYRFLRRQVRWSSIPISFWIFQFVVIYTVNIQKTKIMASGPVTSWQVDGETMETGTDFILGGSKITADGDCSHDIKGHVLLGRKVMTNLDSLLKSRDITLPAKVCLVKTMVFPVIMYGCDSWTIKKAEHRRIDAFELCWEFHSFWTWESLGQQGDPTSPS